MKRFRPLSLEEQRAHYPVLLKRQYSRAKVALLEQFEDELFQANRYDASANTLDDRVGRLEDRVADKADKTYGGWDKWRHDRKLLVKVMTEMHAASASIRDRQYALRDKAARLRQPYLQEVERLDILQTQLLTEFK